MSVTVVGLLTLNAKQQGPPRMEAWTNLTPRNVPLVIVRLQAQYCTLSTNMRCCFVPDPDTNELSVLVNSLFSEKLILHYNGHGMVEHEDAFWLRENSSHVPYKVANVSQWPTPPFVIVYDCSQAGRLLEAYEAHSTAYQLAACSMNQLLPTIAHLPTDMFTACLTTPIQTAIRWHLYAENPQDNNQWVEHLSEIVSVAKAGADSPFDHLSAIFVAIADAVAWISLPNNLFLDLFRKDPLISNLFRNYLLAQRILRALGCTPVCSPTLPMLANHPLWTCWDHELAICIAQLENITAKKLPVYNNLSSNLDFAPIVCAEPEYSAPSYVHSSFFSDMQTGVQVWLNTKSQSIQKGPDHLPILLRSLQYPLIQLNGLKLLCRVLDEGVWAVQECACAGIITFVLDLMYSEHVEQLSFIWAKLLSVDLSCREHLLKTNNVAFFFVNLSSKSHQVVAYCSFVIASICYRHKNGQLVCQKQDAMLYALIDHECALVRKWVCFAIAFSAKEPCLQVGTLLTDADMEIRAAAVFLLGKFFYTNLADLLLLLLPMLHDSCSIVRSEVVIALSGLVADNITLFNTAMNSSDFKMLTETKQLSLEYSAVRILKALMIATKDPDFDIASLAQSVIDFVTNLISSPLSSSLYEQCREYFTLCLLKQKQPDYEKQYLVERNANHLELYMERCAAPIHCSWRQLKCLPRRVYPIDQLRYHAYQGLLFAGAGPELLCFKYAELKEHDVWVPIDLRPDRKVTALECINEDVSDLLAVGWDDGVLGLYSNFAQSSTWRGIMGDPISVLHFISSLNSLVYAGNARTVKLWDVDKCHVVCEMFANSSVTSIGCDEFAFPHVLIVGCVDGSIRLLDVREKSGGPVAIYKEHVANVLCVKTRSLSGTSGIVHFSDANLFYSGSSAGTVKIWDIRQQTSLNTIKAFRNPTMTTFDVHNCAPLMVCGSLAQRFKLFDTKGKLIRCTTHYEGFLGQRLGVIGATAFHPIRPTLAVGCNNGFVTIYKD